MPPLHNAIKYGSDFLRAYSRIIGLGEEEEGTVRLGETLTPILDLWGPPEFALPRGDVFASGTTDITSAAGTLPEALLLNPTGSGILAVLESMLLAITSAAPVFYARLNAGALPAGFVAVNSGPIDFRNPRLIAASSTRCIVAQAANAATDGGLSFDEITLLASETFTDARKGIILAPGSGLIVRRAAAGANTLRVSFRWRERRLLPGELRVT